MSMKHCKHNKLGEFDYDDNEFELQFDEILRYIGKETDGSKIKIPEGIKDCSYMFASCKNLEKVPVIPEGVKDCHRMFHNCTNLKEAPVILKGVENCRFMFEFCTNLKEAPVISKGVEDCSFMFYGCKNLEKAPVIPEGVKDCGCMFWDCENITVAPVIPESVKDCGAMFRDCSENIQKACEWNIEHRGKDYYIDGPGKEIKDSINKVMSKAGSIKSDDFEKKGLGE